MEAGFTAAVAKLDLEPNLSKLALSIFESCQPAISESCTGGHSSQVPRQLALIKQALLVAQACQIEAIVV